MNAPADRYFKNIIARRDRRYDGRFYFGVKTTKIYCRPVCPAQPKPENIVIFKSLSEAERMGFRACLRCHPDLAPGSKSLDGTINTVSRALRIINDMSAYDLNVPKLSKTLGMTDRHLRRLFDEHLGAAPIEIMVTQRLHLAKQLICETTRSITEIALAVGFRSIRRFNEAFKERYRKPPSEFRKTNGVNGTDVLSLKIPIRLPYDWDYVIDYLHRHEIYGVERIEHGRYQRFIPFKKKYGSVVVSKKKAEEYLSVAFNDVPLSEVRFVLGRLKSLFDTDHNPAHLPSTKRFAPNGIRVPGSFDPFETAVSIVLSQWISTVQAKSKLKALVQRFGRKMADGVFAFPSSTVLADAEIEIIGVTRAKGYAIRELAKAVQRGSLEQMPPIKGIGPWTVSMIAMRCLGDSDAFPQNDLLVQRAVEKKWVNPEDWISSRAYLTHCLWRDSV